MRVNKKAIIKRYSNIKAFCKEENLSESLVYHIHRKKTEHFQTNSKAFKTYQKLDQLGYIIEEED